MNSLITPRQIEIWSPDSWDDFAGNDEAVETFKGFVENGPCNTLITGPSRTGKTRLVRLLARSLCCRIRVGYNPCGACCSCLEPFVADQHWYGVWKVLNDSKWSFFHFDCTRVSVEEILDLRIEFDDRTLIFLDEVDQLLMRRIDDRLLKVIDESAAVWIGSAIQLQSRWIRLRKRTREIERMKSQMRGRFTFDPSTSLPNPDQLEKWIHSRCSDWSIQIDSPNLVIPVIAKRTGRNIRFVKDVFVMAATRSDRRITEKLAREINFDTPN